MALQAGNALAKALAGVGHDNPLTAKGDLLGVEVKAGANVGKDDFKHLKWFGENLAKVPYTGILLYAGEYVQCFGEGYYAVPMSCLV